MITSITAFLFVAALTLASAVRLCFTSQPRTTLQTLPAEIRLCSACRCVIDANDQVHCGQPQLVVKLALLA